MLLDAIIEFCVRDYLFIIVVTLFSLAHTQRDRAQTLRRRDRKQRNPRKRRKSWPAVRDCAVEVTSYDVIAATTIFCIPEHFCTRTHARTQLLLLHCDLINDVVFSYRSKSMTHSRYRATTVTMYCAQLKSLVLLRLVSSNF